MSTNVQIAFFGTTPNDRTAFCDANSLYDFDIRFFEERMTPATAALAAGSRVLCAGGSDDLSRETISGLAKNGVRLIALRTTGFANVNMAAAHSAGIEVCRVTEYCTASTAEYALALLLSLTRKLHRAYCRVREGDFRSGTFTGTLLRGRTAGIAGTGRTGKHFASLLGGFGVRILAYDPSPDHEAAAKYNFKYVSFPELLRHSDIISLHCPLTSANAGMLGKDAFARMKHGAAVINTGRSGLIDMEALLHWVRSGRSGGAAFDIYEEESGYFPALPSPYAVNKALLEELIKEKNVLVTCKQSIQTRECLAGRADSVLHNIACFAGDLPKDPEAFICSSCSGTRSCPGKPSFLKCTPPELAVSDS